MKLIMTLGKTKNIGKVLFWKAAPYAGAFFLCLMGASFRISGMMAALGTAAAAAFPDQYILFSTLGAMVGYCVSGFYENIPYLISLLCILGWRGMTARYQKLRENDLSLCVSVFLAVFIPLCVKNLAEEGTGVNLAFYLAESLLAASLSYFFKNGMGALESYRKINVMGNIRKISLCVTAAVWLAMLWNLQLAPFNFGRILTVMLLLFFSYRFGSRDAAFFGLCISAAVTLCLGDYTELLFVLCMGAVLSGFFTPFGRLTHGLIFFAVAAAGFLMTQEVSGLLLAFCDTVVGILLFLLLPEKKLAAFNLVNSAAGAELAYNQRMALKLRFTSEAINDMKEAVEAISDKLYSSGINNLQSVYDKTTEQVCRKCGLKMFCWETAFSQSSEAFQSLSPILREKGSVEWSDLPAYFKNKCAKIEDILRHINSGYREYISAEAAQRKVREAKMVAAEQFEGISGMLCNFSDELAEIASIETERAVVLKNFLKEIGENIADVYCINDEFGRMRIEIYGKSPLKNNENKVTSQISELMERKFSLPTTVSAGNMTKIVFFEEARYRLDFACAQKNAGQNRISGDCCEHFADTKGFFHMILSDGMGTGGRAAVDSIMTCNFVLKLLKSGFGFDSALKLINSALLVKAGGESLATLDICCVDLYTGTARFLKAGAVSSFIRHGENTLTLEGSSLPIGILHGIHYDRHTVSLKSGDMVVMVTDGALFSSSEALKNEITALSCHTAGEAAQRLLELCGGTEGSPKDDITVAVGILREN